MITLKLGTPEWSVVWDVVSSFVENERTDGVETDPEAAPARVARLRVGEALMAEMGAEMARYATREVTKREPIKVCCTVHRVMTRAKASLPPRYHAKLTSRGTWVEMYKSKPCSTEQEARALADKYLGKNADRLVLS